MIQARRKPKRSNAGPVNFVSFADVVARFRGRSVAVVGSAPSVLDNAPGFVDSHEIVVRVNNHKVGQAQGMRTDVHYAFYGTSVKKQAADLRDEGVTLCMCKCPNGKPIDSQWHEQRGKQMGIDFRWIYEMRSGWWFCDTYVPDTARFLEKFNLLERHIPTTGFAAVLDVLACEPGSVYLTGFDFFSSGVHNVNETWRPGDPADPIGHRPQLEAAWLQANASRHPITFDAKLASMLRASPVPAEAVA